MISVYLKAPSISINRVMDNCAAFTGGNVQIRPLCIAQVRSPCNGAVTGFGSRVDRMLARSTSCGVLRVLGGIVSNNANNHVHTHCNVGTPVKKGANAARGGSSN